MNPQSSSTRRVRRLAAVVTTSAIATVGVATALPSSASASTRPPASASSQAHPFASTGERPAQSRPASDTGAARAGTARSSFERTQEPRTQPSTAQRSRTSSTQATTARTGTARGSATTAASRSSSRSAASSSTATTRTTTTTASTVTTGSTTTPQAGTPASSSGLRLTAGAAAVFAQVTARWPSIVSFSGYRANAGDHSTGKSVDFMIPGYSGAGKAIGDAVVAYLQANARQLGISYIIWRQHIWSVARSGEGWRLMADRGSVTANHYDHVHVTVN